MNNSSLVFFGKYESFFLVQQSVMVSLGNFYQAQFSLELDHVEVMQVLGVNLCGDTCHMIRKGKEEKQQHRAIYFYYFFSKWFLPSSFFSFPVHNKQNFQEKIRKK